MYYDIWHMFSHRLALIMFMWLFPWLNTNQNFRKQWNLSLEWHLFDNMDNAKKVAFDKRIMTRTVTLGGDVFDPHGTLSGGRIYIIFSSNSFVLNRMGTFFFFNRNYWGWNHSVFHSKGLSFHLWQLLINGEIIHCHHPDGTHSLIISTIAFLAHLFLFSLFLPDILVCYWGNQSIFIQCNCSLTTQFSFRKHI